MHKKTKTFALIVFSNILFLILTACGGPIIATATPSPTLTPLPSSTVTPTATPSPTLCPTLINQQSPGLVSLSPVFVVVLYDDEQTSFNSMELMTNVIQKVAAPGDGLAMVQSGYFSDQFDISKTIVLTSPLLEVPDIVLSPTSISTLTPQAIQAKEGTPVPPSTPDISDLTIFNAAETQTAFPVLATQTINAYKTQVSETEVAAQSTSTASFATATEIAVLNQCAGILWDNAYADLDAEWQATKAANQMDFLTQIAGTLEPQKDISRPTPHAGTDLYGGLASASLIFSNYCQDDTFSRCILIILDDLYDWRPKPPPKLEIQFDNVDVISILMSCSETYSPSSLCQPAQEHWTPQFQLFGANTIQYHNNQDIENFLVGEISKNR